MNSQHSLNFLFCIAIIGLSGCTTTTDQIRARLPEHGNVVNGRSAIQGDNFAFVESSHQRMTGDRLTIVEFDGKPFFIEYKSPIIWDNGKWLRAASPIDLVPGSELVISPGQHSLRLMYQTVENALLFKTLWTSGEITVEFVAEKGHGYEILPNMTSKKSDKAGPPIRTWSPTITDRDVKAEARGK